MKSTKGFSVSDWCRNFEISFQGEQGMFLTEYDNISLVIGRDTSNNKI